MDVKMSIHDFPPSQNKSHKYYVYLLCTAVGEVVSVTSFRNSNSGNKINT